MPSLEDVLTYLSNQNLKPIKVTVSKKGQKGSLLGGLLKGKVKLSDQIFLFKYLALMLKVGTDLLRAVDTIMQDYETGPVKDFLLDARSNLEKGNPFYLIFEQNKNIFTYVTTNLIKAGEKSGTLQETLEKISVSLEKDKELKGKVIASLTYPIILIVMMFFLIFFLMVFLFPKMGQSFMMSGMKLPAFTKMLIKVSTFFNSHLTIVMAAVILIPAALFFYFFKTKTGTHQFSVIIRKIPPIRNFLNKMALQRMASVLSSLIKAGMPLVEALKVTSEAVGEEVFRKSLFNIAVYLTKGLTVGDAFKLETNFPRYLSNLLAIGEKAGHIDEILATLADFYEKEIDNSLKSIVALIEPMMLMIMGVVVGGIAISVILPMYQMIGQF